MKTAVAKPKSFAPRGSAYDLRVESPETAVLVDEAVREASEPIEEGARFQMEALFGRDFSQIRIHSGPAAEAAARALGAEAFTVGRHVIFGSGRYRPESRAGINLLAHELTHTVQNRGAEPDGNWRVAAQNHPAEVEAQRGSVSESSHAAPSGLILRRVAADAAPEQVDPARLAETLTVAILRIWRADPGDVNGSVRRRLIRMAGDSRTQVLRRIRERLSSGEWHRFYELLEQPAPAGMEGTEEAGTPPPSDVPAAAEAPAAAAPTADAAEAPQAQVEQGTVEGAGAPGPEEAQQEVAAGEPASPEVETAQSEGAGGGAAPTAGPATAGAEGGPAGSVEGAGGGGDAPAATVPELDTAESAAAGQEKRTEAQSDSAAPETADGSAQASQSGEAAELAPHGESGAAASEDRGTPSETPEPAEPEAGTQPGPAAEPAPPEAATGYSPAPEPPAPHEAQRPPESEASAPGPVQAEAPAEAEPEAAPAATDQSEAVEAPAPAEASAEPQAAQPAAAPEMDTADSDADSDGGGGAAGGGGGGGGAAAEQPEAPQAEAVPGAQSDPAAAMAASASLRPDRMQTALGGVQQAIGSSTQEQQQQLTAQPPQVERPSGSPEGHQGPAAGAAPAQSQAPGAAAPQLERVATPDGAPAGPTAAAAAPAETQATVPPPPRVTGNADGHMTEADAAHVQNAVNNLPVQDPALNVDAGHAPEIRLEGQSDPAWAARQRTASETAATAAADQGRTEAAAPMGEDNVYPHVPNETLRAEPQGGEGGSAQQSGGGAQAGESADDVEGIVAQSQSGPAIQSAATAASGDLTAKRQEQTQRMDEAEEQNSQQVQQEVDQSSREQAAQRQETQQAVRRQRDEWRTGQQTASRDARAGIDRESQEGERAVRQRHQAANTEAAGEVRQGNQTIQRHRQDAERGASRERDRARTEARGGILGWLASAVTSFFNRIRSAIQAAFARARQLIQDAIRLAQRAASAIIDAARTFIVNRLRALANRLIELANVLLAAFPALRDRFTRAIRAAVELAIAAVNRIADALKNGVQRLLNLLGRALSAILSLYERLYLAILDGVRSVVNSALQAARQVLQAYTAFRDLIRDIAANPGQWVRNLGSSIVDGIRNHLWRALKTAVKRWFNEKVEMLLGVGRMIINVLRQGGIAFRRILSMAWTAIKAALPGIIITFLIQRLVAMLVPAAAAVMMIIQGIQAAWGTVSRIIQAFQAFFAFLRAVKGGNAGPQFATAVAAGAVAVIEFVANFLLARLGRALGGVAGRLRTLAGRFMAMFRRGARAVRGAVSRAVGVARRAAAVIARGARRVGSAVGSGARRAAALAGRGLRRVGAALARTRVGQAILRGYRRVQQGVRNLRDRYRRWRERRRRRPQETPQQRLDRIMRVIRPRIANMVRRGAPRLLLQARLLIWKARYRMQELSIQGSGHNIRVQARVNPGEEVALSKLDPMEISQAVYAATERFLNETPEIVEGSQRIGEAPFREGVQAGTELDPVTVPERFGIPAVVRAMRSGRLAASPPGRSRHLSHGAGGSRSQIREQAPPMGASVSNQLVMPALSYPQVAQEFQSIARASGESPAAIANYARQYTRTGRLPAHMANRRQFFSFLNQLPFIRESVRYTPAMAHGAMTMELLARGPETGGFTPAQAFGGRGREGALPMAMAAEVRHAGTPAQTVGTTTPAAARGLERRHRNVLTGGSTRGAGRGVRTQELARREAVLVRRWILAQFQIEDRIYPDVATARTNIEHLITELLHRYFATRRVAASTEAQQ
jgi:hypothetical protein